MTTLILRPKPCHQTSVLPRSTDDRSNWQEKANLVNIFKMLLKPEVNVVVKVVYKQTKPSQINQIVLNYVL